MFFFKFNGSILPVRGLFGCSVAANSLSGVFLDAKRQLIPSQRSFWTFNGSLLPVKGLFGRSMAAYSLSGVFLDALWQLTHSQRAF